jgi:archaellum biogenesis ATPase FlaH
MDNNAIEIFIDKNKTEYEKYVLVNMWKNPQFYFDYAASINKVYKYENKQDIVCKDFTSSVDNAIYDCLVWYYTPFLTIHEQGLDAPIPIPPKDYFQGLINSQIEQERRLDHYRDGVRQRLEELEQAPAEAYEVIARAGLERWLKSQRVKKAGIELQKTHVNADDFLERMQQTIEDATLIDEEETIKTFSLDYEAQCNADDFQTRKTYPISIQGINRAMGGGFARGETTMVFAPENCGKTVFATQVSKDFAEHELNVAFISTEQGQVDLYPRFITNYCNIPFDQIKHGVNIKNLTDSKKKSLHQWHQTVGQRLRVVEWNKRAVEAKQQLRPMLNKMQSGGFPVDVVIYDWLGGGLGNLSRNDLNNLRMIFKQNSDELCYVARDYNMIVIFLMQAAIGTALNKPLLTQADLGECKAAGQNCDWGFAISGMQESVTKRNGETKFGNTKQTWADIQHINPFKVRKSIGGAFKVKREFGFQRFIDAEAVSASDQQGNQLKQR